MPDTDKQEQKQPTIEWVKSPSGILEVYGNFSHIQWTLDDVRVRIAQLVSSPDSLTPGPVFKAVAEERAAVTMSWRNAKNLRNQLSKLIDNYEKLNGEIVLDIKLATPAGSPTSSVQ